MRVRQSQAKLNDMAARKRAWTKTRERFGLPDIPSDMRMFFYLGWDARRAYDIKRERDYSNERVGQEDKRDGKFERHEG